MSRFILTVLLLSYFQPVFSQITGSELLRKTIEYHDPEGNWTNLSARLFLEQSRPNGSSRSSEVILKNGQNYFKLIERMENDVIIRELQNDSCTVTFNGSEDFSQEISDKYRLSNDRILRTRNYYVYLYGLPMKLTDPGTNVNDEVKEASFDGKDYLELAVTYDKDVGSDDWFFYINPSTYTMEGYKFYHENGKGEFITIEGLSTIGGVKIPKLRQWYTTQDSTFLGADDLTRVELISK